MRLKERDVHRLGRVVVTEEMLDDLADRYHKLVIRGASTATFEQYAANPGYYDLLEEALGDGMGLHRDDRAGGWVPVAVGPLKRAESVMAALLVIGASGVIPNRDWSIRSMDREWSR